jgi:hypothetical protein
MTLEQKARCAARRVGLVARKSRSGFALLEERDRVVVGARLTPTEVIDLCTAAFNYGGD